MKQYAQNINADNPTALAVKGGGRKTATRKRAAKDADNEDADEASKPKKRSKKAAKGSDLTGEEADKMMELGGGEEQKVRDEPEDMGFGWGANGEGAEEEV
jgi:hypothetical protein